MYVQSILLLDLSANCALHNIKRITQDLNMRGHTRALHSSVLIKDAISHFFMKGTLNSTRKCIQVKTNSHVHQEVVSSHIQLKEL